MEDKNEPVNESIYERYVHLKECLGLKDSDVARETGLPKSAFSDWKNGRYIPKIDNLYKISTFLGVSFDYFVTGTGDPYQETFADNKEDTLKGRIKSLALKHSVSIPSLESALGFGNSTIVKWGKSIPSADKLNAVAKYFNVSMEYLLDGVESANQKDIKIYIDKLAEKLEESKDKPLYYGGAVIKMTDTKRQILKDLLNIAICTININEK